VGHVVLDLMNTVTGRESLPTDWLETYERVLEWAALSTRSTRTPYARSTG